MKSESFRGNVPIQEIMDQNIFLSGISIYPIKSMSSIALDTANVEQRGLQHDRRWMLIDENNNCITQREHPSMARIAVGLESDGLTVSSQGTETLFIPFSLGKPNPIKVQIFRNVCDAVVAGNNINQWFSDFLGTSCKLVYMPDDSRRAVNPNYAVKDDIVSFADGYPFLLIGNTSLDELNNRLDQLLPMNRFRPNLVITGANAFGEDNWKMIRIGETVFHVVKPCDRCSLTTIEQETGMRAGKEPLKTLATFCMEDNDVFFGQYLIADDNGVVRVGDKVEIIEYKN